MNKMEWRVIHWALSNRIDFLLNLKARYPCNSAYQEMIEEAKELQKKIESQMTELPD